MSTNIPPKPNVDTFNNLYWADNNETLTITEADARYLRFPIAQGTENLQAINVNGVSTFNGNSTFNQPADFNTTLNVDGLLTTTNQIQLNGGTVGLSTLLLREIRLRDTILGANNGSKISTTSNVLTVDSVPQTGGFNSQINLSIRDTLDTVITPLNLSTTAITTTLPINLNNNNITNFNTISGNTNTNVSLRSTGTGHLQLWTGGVNRAVITDTAEFRADTKGLYIQGTSGTDGQVRVGLNTGAITQGNGSVMVGGGTLGISQGVNSIAIGQGAGQLQINNCIAIGNGAGKSQSSTAIAIGQNAGSTSQNANTVAIGSGAGLNSQAGGGVAIGQSAGETQSVSAVSIGQNSGKSQGANSIAIGLQAAGVSQSDNCVAIGNSSGNSGQLSESVAVGFQAGQSGQSSGWSIGGDGSVAVGVASGATNQAFRSVAIGGLAGGTSQGSNNVAIGYGAGNNTQALGSVAIGSLAGQTNQKSATVFIGYNAGNAGGGINSVYIGSNCGTTSVLSNSIILNASGAAYNPITNQGFYVNPVRGRAAATPVVVYDAATGEVTYNTSSIKYKKNVIDLTTDTSVLHNLRAREYDSKDDNTHHVGYIAEEVDAVDTNFSWKNPDGTPEGLEWFNMLIYAIEEIKKLRIEVNQLKGL